MNAELAEQIAPMAASIYAGYASGLSSKELSKLMSTDQRRAAVMRMSVAHAVELWELLLEYQPDN